MNTIRKICTNISRWTSLLFSISLLISGMFRVCTSVILNTYASYGYSEFYLTSTLLFLSGIIMIILGAICFFTSIRFLKQGTYPKLSFLVPVFVISLILAAGSITLSLIILSIICTVISITIEQAS